jgi:hypothetical protein
VPQQNWAFSTPCLLLVLHESGLMLLRTLPGTLSRNPTPFFPRKNLAHYRQGFCRSHQLTTGTTGINQGHLVINEALLSWLFAYGHSHSRLALSLWHWFFGRRSGMENKRPQGSLSATFISGLVTSPSLLSSSPTYPTFLPSLPLISYYH